MTRHAQPREIAALKGSIAKNPQRYKRELPKVDYDLGMPPDHMPEDAKAVWHEIATYAPVEVLKGADRLMLEIVANSIAVYRRDPENYPAQRLGQLMGGLGRLGMSPADRQKLGVEKPKEADPFDGF
jgi:hypothetical protein